MRQHTKRLADMRKFEDPRLSFSTPEFRESQRIFTENFKVSRNPYPSLTLSPYHAPHRASRPVSGSQSSACISTDSPEPVECERAVLNEGRVNTQQTHSPSLLRLLRNTPMPRALPALVTRRVT
jgi:hypothetical protein